MKRKFYLLTLFIVSFMFLGCNQSIKIELFPVMSGDEYQYIDRKGKIVINPQFSEASLFRDGIALVKTSGEDEEYGYIDKRGKYLILPQYKDATIFSEGIAWVVVENGYPTAINEKGVILFSLKDAEDVFLFKEGLAAFSQYEKESLKWGFVDKKGNIKISPQFDAISYFSEGKCAVENSEGKWGYIDKEGRVEITYQFDYAGDFFEGQSIVIKNDKFGVIDKNGKYVINPQYAYMMEDNSLYLLKVKDKWGWCDKKGKIIINPQFVEAYPFFESSLASVKMNNRYGYINKKGNIEISPQFTAAFPFTGDIAFVENGEQIGCIDKKGKFVINPQFDDLGIDIYAHLFGEKTFFDKVSSDFFNTTPILHRINIKHPENLSFSYTLKEVMKKYNFTESDLNPYQEEQKIIRYEQISQDASMSFSIIFEDAFKDFSWWNDVINFSAPISIFTYQIDLSGRGYGKGKLLKEELQKSLTNYNKIDSLSENGIDVYKNKEQYIMLINGYSDLYILIFKNINKLQQTYYTKWQSKRRFANRYDDYESVVDEESDEVEEAVESIFY